MSNCEPELTIYALKLTFVKFNDKKMLKRREENDTYLTHVCRHTGEERAR